MAQFFKAKKPTASRNKTLDITIEQFNHDGQGIGYINNKICFVEGALPGERVSVKLIEDKAKLAKARTVKVIKASKQRIEPQCVHFAACGGCQLQYVNADHQVQLKRQAVSDLFKRFANIESLPWQDDLKTHPWQYRRAARIGVWYDIKTKQYTVGFRQRNSKLLTPINHCAVLVDAFKNVFNAFAKILPALKVGRAITHLEVLNADNHNVVVVRHTRAMAESDKEQLFELAKTNDWLIVSEFDKGQFDCLGHNEVPELYYLLEQYNSKLTFRIGDFIQVNADINRQMVAQAQQWLVLEKTDVVLDLFCGIGNFSLPLASVCDKVVGVEGVDAMVQQASHNAALNGLDNAQYYQADLSEDLSVAGKKRNKPDWLAQSYSKILLDPARAGASQIIPSLAELKAQKILYVSCDPLTLARDSSVLLSLGYQLKKIALMDMFAQTRHVEVMALFEQKG